MKKIILLFLLLSGQALAIETKATNAYLVDYDTGVVLLNKKGEEPMTPASMSKLMTTYILFDKIKSGEVQLDDVFVVSKNAWKKGGAASGSSTMFLNPNQKVKVQDLIRGILIQSGNDACITVAENISGSEEQFAVLMNEVAQKIGLMDSSFSNSTGWPDKNQKMSGRDLVKLSTLIIRRFPEFYPILSEKEFTYNNIRQGNRNPLLYSMPNQVDGLKTGHTSVSGYGLTASATNLAKDRRLILVINGLKSEKERGAEAQKLFNWGFSEYDNYRPIKKGDVIGQGQVWMGKNNVVPMVVEDDVLLTLNKQEVKNIEFTVQYERPIPAPIKKGDTIGNLKIIAGDYEYIYPLKAGEDIEKVGIFGKIPYLFGKK